MGREIKFGWTIIRPVCLHKFVLHEPTSKASIYRVTIMREEPPVHNSRHNSGNVLACQISHPNCQTDIVTHFVANTQMKDITSPQHIHEMMKLDFSELNYNCKTPRTELVQSIKDRRFCQIISTEIHKNHLGNWESPLPFKKR